MHHSFRSGTLGRLDSVVSRRSSPPWTADRAVRGTCKAIKWVGDVSEVQLAVCAVTGSASGTFSNRRRQRSSPSRRTSGSRRPLQTIPRSVGHSVTDATSGSSTIGRIGRARRGRETCYVTPSSTKRKLQCIIQLQRLRAALHNVRSTTLRIGGPRLAPMTHFRTRLRACTARFPTLARSLLSLSSFHHSPPLSHTHSSTRSSTHLGPP